MEKAGECKMDRQNKKCSCAGKSGRRKNNAGTVKDEEKMAGPLAKKELPAEGCYRRNDKRAEGSWQEKISDVCRYEKEAQKYGNNSWKKILIISQKVGLEAVS